MNVIDKTQHKQVNYMIDNSKNKLAILYIIVSKYVWYSKELKKQKQK